MNVRFDFEVNEVEDILKEYVLKNYPQLRVDTEINVDLSTYSSTRVTLTPVKPSEEEEEEEEE